MLAGSVVEKQVSSRTFGVLWSEMMEAKSVLDGRCSEEPLKPLFLYRL